MRGHSPIVALLVLGVGCSLAPGPDDGGGEGPLPSDAGARDESDPGPDSEPDPEPGPEPSDDAGARDPRDGGPTDASHVDPGGGEPFDPGPVPSGPLLPVPGELSIWQLYMPSLGFPPGLAEAAAIIGPDGTLVLLDVGNRANDDDVRDVVRTLNEEVLTVERGYPARAPMQVEWIVLTHFHSDHVGAFERLITHDEEPITGLIGVVHRGFTTSGRR